MTAEGQECQSPWTKKKKMPRRHLAGFPTQEHDKTDNSNAGVANKLVDVLAASNAEARTCQRTTEQRL